MRVLVATDAWRPQVNGVVRTYERLAAEAPRQGAELCFLSPSDFRTIPMPTYAEIRVAIPDYAKAARLIDAMAPDAVHIATEGPVGLMARSWCRRRGRPFTTCYHTRFPEYLAQRGVMPTAWSYAYQRWFHNSGAGTMVATRNLGEVLTARGFRHILPWTRGVDGTLFRPRPERMYGAGPVFLYVGRVAIEKGLEAFLALDLPGRKVVVGAGPQLAELRRRFPEVTFDGERLGDELAKAYASADVFVFPSRTDTFGIVLLEAIASGVPVAAFPVIGPIDVVKHGVTGVLSDDLGAAAIACLSLDRARVAAEAAEFSWASTCRQFLSNIETAVFANRGRSTPGHLARPSTQRA